MALISGVLFALSMRTCPEQRSTSFLSPFLSKESSKTSREANKGSPTNTASIKLSSRPEYVREMRTQFEIGLCGMSYQLTGWTKAKWRVSKDYNIDLLIIGAFDQVQELVRSRCPVGFD